MNMLNKLKKWLTNKAASVFISLSNVEKNTITKISDQVSNDTHYTRRNTQGTLADSLINGEVTQEVQNLRWRTYKILNQVSGYKSKIVGYDEDGLPVTEMVKLDVKKELDGINLDTADSYVLEMVVDNSEITNNTNDIMFGKHLLAYDVPKIMTSGSTGDFIGNIGIDDKIPEVLEKFASHGTINNTEYQATNKTERPLFVGRDFFPKFNIEDYTTKLNIRRIDDEHRLLEFYVSKYPDTLRKNSGLFVKEVIKAMSKPIHTNFLEIKNVSFVTDNTIGATNYLRFTYDILKFDKIVEFNGSYVIKFIGKISINGVNIFEEFRVTELDAKYKNKEKK
jgi:hypothetical protein